MAFVLVLRVLVLMAFQDAKQVIHVSALCAQRQQNCPRTLSCVSTLTQGSLPALMEKRSRALQRKQQLQEIWRSSCSSRFSTWAPRAGPCLSLALGRSAPDLHLAYEAESFSGDLSLFCFLVAEQSSDVVLKY